MKRTWTIIGGERCAEKFHVVPIIVRPAGDIS